MVKASVVLPTPVLLEAVSMDSAAGGGGDPRPADRFTGFQWR